MEQNISELEDLPNEVLVEILDGLSIGQLINVMEASKDIKERMYPRYQDMIYNAKVVHQRQKRVEGMRRREEQRQRLVQIFLNELANRIRDGRYTNHHDNTYRIMASLVEQNPNKFRSGYNI